MAPRQKIAVHYDSEDVNDETVYNSFTNNKERLAFIKEREISDQGRATNNRKSLPSPLDR